MKKFYKFVDASLGLKFKRINDLFVQRRNDELQSAGITISQMPVLFYLEMNDGQKVNQKELCEAVKVTHPTMIGLLNRLKKNGMIEKKVDDQNRRCLNISLTDKGRKCLTETRNRREATEHLLVRGMNSEEVSELHRLLGIVYENLKEVEPDGEKEK